MCGFLDKLQKLGNEWGIMVNESKCPRCGTINEIGFFTNPIAVRCKSCKGLMPVA